EDLLDLALRLPRAAVCGDDAAAECGGAARDLAPDPAESDDANSAAQDLAMRRAALHPAGLPRGADAKVALDFPEAVAPDQHDHQNVFGDRWLVAKGIADRA